MNLFVDASALVAICRGEPEMDELISALERSHRPLTNGIAMWEASRALARDHVDGLSGGLFEVRRYIDSFCIAIVPIGGAEANEAVGAQQRYGKGTGHPAQLNMGDCFAYACAKTNSADLLYKGQDFIHTDLR